MDPAKCNLDTEEVTDVVVNTLKAETPDLSNVSLETDSELPGSSSATKIIESEIEDIFEVVAPKGKMKEKHENAAPYYMFFNTITSAPETHSHPLSITFQELLDSSLGKLKDSLQLNYFVDCDWLHAQYYFAGYSDNPLTVLYGLKSRLMEEMNEQKDNYEFHLVTTENGLGLHHIKMGIYHYEDESITIVISTANLNFDDWDNKTQSLWMSPKCPRLADLNDNNGESPTGFKKSLIDYLNSYNTSYLSSYIEIVKNIDFSSINVFFVASTPGIYFDAAWGQSCIGNLLSKYCIIPADEADEWAFIAQASSIGGYGYNPKSWLCGYFQENFCSCLKVSPITKILPKLKLIYPTHSNVKNSHDGLYAGATLPYKHSLHVKQQWLDKLLHQWSAVHSDRNKAMPHMKSYLRVSPDCKRAAYFLLTSGNISKNAWGTYDRTNGGLRINSYEGGVLFIPKFVIGEDYFPLELSDPNRIPVPYDLPPVPYESDDIPWVIEYYPTP
ncbi:tyrosyl-DNA phosphodiesterase 1-like isoform X2 [Arctopsyche grandis]|uniref:tyrosyl-DNA phosphodiesterase 1-like isoform X2 n=1 Tax=Arctopsyche grandis TaxID=121162 RepID=UPI00406D7AAA